MISRSRSALSWVRTRAIASASPVTLQASTTSGWRRRRVGDLVEQGARGVEQLDQRLGVIAQGGVVEDRGEALERAPAAQAVDAALDRRRRQRHAAGDVVVGAPAVLDEQRKNLSILVIHAAIYCRDCIDFGIDNRRRREVA